MMHISQPSVAEMERKADMLLSTLRGYAGELRLVAIFPDVPSEVTIDLAPSPPPRRQTTASQEPRTAPPGAGRTH